MTVFENHSILEDEENSRQILDEAYVTAGHVCSVVLKNLRKAGIELSREKFLEKWNKIIEIGGCGYARIKDLESREEVSSLALDRLGVLLQTLKVPMDIYIKIYKEIGQKLSPSDLCCLKLNYREIENNR